MTTIDGRHGEGGGQIVRTALSLSAILSMPVKITGIRAGRPKPGLRPQHLTGVLAMAELCGAGLEGAAIDSTSLTFDPGVVVPGAYAFDVSRIKGSAGSVSLVFQTLLPVLALAKGGSRLSLSGGTHVPWSPPFHFVAGSFRNSLARMGVAFDMELHRWGFYPKGGGEAAATVKGGGSVSPAAFTDRGRLSAVRVVSAVANLPMSIARRQAESAAGFLDDRGVAAEVELVDAPSPGQGTFVYIQASFENADAGFSALGARGRRAEDIGEEAAGAFFAYLDSGACVEQHLADQLIVYMALAARRGGGGVSEMSVSRLTRHLFTNAWVIGRFMPEVKITINGREGGQGIVTMG